MNTQLVVGAIVDYRYDYVLVALSFVISVLGSYVALSLASSAGKNGDSTFGPAIALGGCAIWSMHFIGMAAYKTPLYVSYAILPAAYGTVEEFLSFTAVVQTSKDPRPIDAVRVSEQYITTLEKVLRGADQHL